jgi:UTP--glucose-1-phosphate uridylyltransferase
MRACDNVLGLPLIVNHKTVDPTDPTTPNVLQLETAMGAAISVFEGAELLCVPRTRFAPVKTASDLLVLRSDAFELSSESRVQLVAERRGRIPLVSLDERYFKRLSDFEARFPYGAPSLVDCDRLSVQGDVIFGPNVVCRGSVSIEGPCRIPGGTTLSG